MHGNGEVRALKHTALGGVPTIKIEKSVSQQPLLLKAQLLSFFTLLHFGCCHAEVLQLPEPAPHELGKPFLGECGCSGQVPRL